MLYLNLEDMVLKRARNNRIAQNSKKVTNALLWSGLGLLIVTGKIGMLIVGECVFMGGINKGTKWIIKHRKDVLNRIKSKNKTKVTYDRG